MAEHLPPIADALKPTNLGPRGEALWLSLGGDTATDGARAALIVEACRLADQLDKLDQIISGDDATWLQLEIPEGRPIKLIVPIQNAIAERRQSVTVFRHVLAQLWNVGTPAGEVAGSGSPKEASVDDLAKRRAARRSAAADL
ncbi:MAG: hypothetical protein ACI38R_22715 [Rhodococcus sp. (in: high G+C Gram-positive bacteria)]